jgi:uncharacterized protein
VEVVYRLAQLEFERDSHKASRNFRKHGVVFEQGAEVFLDPFVLYGDATVDEAEQREFVLGYSFADRLLLVVHVERSARIRIISVRPATPAERRIYGNQ